MALDFIPPELGAGHAFPNPENTDAEGLVAWGGDFHPQRLKAAYFNGIFPWYAEPLPILWYCPPKRFVILPEHFRIPKSLKPLMKKHPWTISQNQNPAGVLQACASIPRPDQEGTWLTPSLQKGLLELAKQQMVHSVEVWQGDQMVAGIYGLVVGTVFCGESMFTTVPNASKVAFATLANGLFNAGCAAIDCQVYSDHLRRFGAEEINRKSFLEMLHLNRTNQLHTSVWV